MKENYIKNPRIVKEVKRISEKHGGVLKPIHIVEAASSKKSLLHKYFEWDDTIAAQKYRLHQARMFINILVEVIEEKQDPINVFVSLRKDRVGEETGYRQLVDVMNDKEYRANLLHDALEEMEYFKRKYSELKELAGVFAAMEKVKKRVV